MKLPSISFALILGLSTNSCNKSDQEAEGENEPPVTVTPSISRQEEFANEIMDAMEDFAAAVSIVSDLDSANEAASKIGAIGDRFAQIANQLKPLDPAPMEIKEKINGKMEAREAEMQKAMGEEFQKTTQALNSETQQVLQKAFGEFFRKMDSAGKEFERHLSVQDEPSGVR
jgi:hypothetical protein